MNSDGVLGTLLARIEGIRQERAKYHKYLTAKVDESLKSYDIAIAELEYAAGLMRKEQVVAPVIPRPVATDWGGQLRQPMAGRRATSAQPVTKDLDVNQQILMKSIQHRAGGGN